MRPYVGPINIYLELGCALTCVTQHGLQEDFVFFATVILLLYLHTRRFQPGFVTVSSHTDNNDGANLS